MYIRLYILSTRYVCLYLYTKYVFYFILRSTFVRSCVRSFVQSFVLPSVRPFDPLFLHSFIPPFFHSILNSFARRVFFFVLFLFFFSVPEKNQQQFFFSPLLPSVVRCGLVGLQLHHREAQRGVLHCFEEVVGLAMPQLPGGKANPGAQQFAPTVEQVGVRRTCGVGVGGTVLSGEWAEKRASCIF